MKEFNLEQCFNEDNGRAIWLNYDVYVSRVPLPDMAGTYLGFHLTNYGAAWFNISDLKNIPRKRQGWINIRVKDYEAHHIERLIYRSKEEAIKDRDKDTNYHGDPVMIYEVEE